MINTLTTQSLCRNLASWANHVSDSFLIQFVNEASWKVSGSIDDYYSLLGYIESGSSYRATQMQRAETYFAISYAVIPLSTTLQQGGGFLTEIGFESDRTVIMDIPTAERLSAYYEAQGEKILFNLTNVSASAASSSLDYVTDGSFFAGAI